MLKKIGRTTFYAAFFIALFALLLCFLPSERNAFAEDEFTVEKVYYLDEEGEEVEIDSSDWAIAAPRVRVRSSVSLLSFTLYNTHTGELFDADLYPTERLETQEGVVQYVLPETAEGDITVKITQTEQLGTGEYRELKSLSVALKTDYAPPVAPVYFEEEWQRILPLADTDGEYYLHFDNPYDAVSGMDYLRSSYRFENALGVSEEGSLSLPAPERDGSCRVGAFYGNGTLVLDLYDVAGNHREYRRTYSNYLRPEIAPVIGISVDPDAWSKSVSFEISWQGYDPEFTSCHYELFYNGKSAGKQRYRSPILIDAQVKEQIVEGSVTLRAYYWVKGRETYVETAPYEKLDVTAPSSAVIEESLHIRVDLLSDVPVYLLLRAADSRSGIASVALEGGETFEQYGVDQWRLPVTDRNVFPIVVTDRAGNATRYTFPRPNFDYASALEYAARYRALDSADYAPEGWEKVVTSLSLFGAYFNQTNPSTSEFARLKGDCDAAIAGELNPTVRFTSSPDGFGSFLFRISPDAVENVKKGERVDVRIGAAQGLDAALINETIDSAAIPNAGAYTFSMRIYNTQGDYVLLKDSISFTFRLSTAAADAKVYFYDGNSVTLVSSATESGQITVTTQQQGNFIVVAAGGKREEILPAGFYVGSSYYRWDYIGIAIAIIVGTVGISLGAIFLILKKKKRK